MGLNNYNLDGTGHGTRLLFSATKLDQGSLKGWTCMSMVQHHTMAVDAHSQIYCMPWAGLIMEG